jgi:hypothetical protein
MAEKKQRERLRTSSPTSDGVTDGFPSQLVDTLSRSIGGLGVSDVHYVLTLGAHLASATDLGRSLGQAEDALALAVRLALLDRVMHLEDLAIERDLTSDAANSSRPRRMVFSSTPLISISKRSAPQPMRCDSSAKYQRRWSSSRRLRNKFV